MLKTVITISEAHERAVNNDRILVVKGAVRGYWYEDHVLDWMWENSERECRVVNETDEIVEVELI